MSSPPLPSGDFILRPGTIEIFSYVLCSINLRSMPSVACENCSRMFRAEERYFSDNHTVIDALLTDESAVQKAIMDLWSKLCVLLAASYQI